jgi:hypothetical protein
MANRVASPLLLLVFSELPLLFGDITRVHCLLNCVHAQIHWNVVSLREVAGGLEEMQRVDDSPPSDAMVADVEDCIQMLLHQRRQLNVALAVLVAVQAVAYTMSRSRFVPGVLLMAASVGVVPGYRTFVSLSVLTLSLLLASDRPRPRRAPRGRLSGRPAPRGRLGRGGSPSR